PAVEPVEEPVGERDESEARPGRQVQLDGVEDDEQRAPRRPRGDHAQTRLGAERLETLARVAEVIAGMVVGDVVLRRGQAEVAARRREGPAAGPGAARGRVARARARAAPVGAGRRPRAAPEARGAAAPRGGPGAGLPDRAGGLLGRAAGVRAPRASRAADARGG